MPFYDLSHSVESGMPVYPGSPPVGVDRRESIPESGARVTDLAFDTHVGTHVDAPSHVVPDGASIDAFDPSAFVFDALRVDCRGLDRRDRVEVADLPAPTDHDLLVLWTGWDAHWGSEAYRDHPYLSAEAAAWCAANGYSVGLDAFSPDPTPSADPARERSAEPAGYPAHDALLGADRFVLENLAGLDDPGPEFTLYAFPLAIRDGDGSPVRAVAASP